MGEEIIQVPAWTYVKSEKHYLKKLFPNKQTKNHTP